MQEVSGIYAYAKEIKSGFIHLQSTNGILSIIQEGMQSYLSHLDPFQLQSLNIPFNKKKFNKLVDLHNSNHVGVIIDGFTFCALKLSF